MAKGTRVKHYNKGQKEKRNYGKKRKKSLEMFIQKAPLSKFYPASYMFLCCQYIEKMMYRYKKINNKLL